MPINLNGRGGGDPSAPSTHEVTVRAVPVRRDPNRPTGRTPRSMKLWTATAHFDPKGTAEFHPERIDPVPMFFDLGNGRTQVMALQFRCIGIDAREAVRHADWMMTIGPRKDRKAIAKLLGDRREQIEFALQKLCTLRGDAAEVLPREGSVVGMATALIDVDGKPEWQPFTWFVQRPRRPFSVSLPEIALLFTKPHEWWRRIKWWYAMYGVSRFLEDDTAVDRWAGPERKAEIDLLVRPFLCRAISSAYAAANQDHEGLQRMFREYDVEMQRTQAIPADLPLDVLLEEHGKSVAARRRAIFDDLGT